MQIPISSSLIAAADYDEQRQELVITFRSGARWVYGSEAQPFTPDDADAFLSAGSKGRYFLDQIRDVFPARRL